MADEDYRWLTKDAAERLLRGEPLAAPGDGLHEADEAARAERLARVLDAARPRGGPAAGELPGESAALAAFRAAGHSVTTIRIGRGTHSGRGAHAAPGRTLWGRPLRFGVAAALAVCTIGGVAVAAGTGVLPSPFGGDPAPAASVSAAASRTPASPLPDITSPGAQEPSAEPGASADPSEPGIGKDSPDREDVDASGQDGDKGEQSGWSKGEWYARVVESCRDYMAGRPLGGEQRRRLEMAAKGSKDIGRFCESVLRAQSGRGDSGGAGEYGGSGSGGGEEGGSSGEDGPSGEDGSSDSDGEGPIVAPGAPTPSAPSPIAPAPEPSAGPSVNAGPRPSGGPSSIAGAGASGQSV